MSDKQLNVDIRPPTALVTGAPGLGSLMALRLADDGFDVTVSRKETDAVSVIAESAEAERRADESTGSVRMLGVPASRAGSVDTLVISAADPVRLPADARTAGDVGTVPTDDSELPRSPVDVARDLVARQQGVVICVVPMAAERESADRAELVAAVESMTHEWASELEPIGVRVNTVIARADPPGGSDLIRPTSHSRDVVEMVSFLASPNAIPMSGTTLSV